MLTTPHRMPGTTLDQLARGYGDGSALSALQAGQLSKHVLLIRAVLQTARRNSKAFLASGLTDAIDILDRVRRTDPEAVSTVLRYPLVGAWAAHCLRRLRHAQRDGPAHLWLELGHLSSVAAAASVLAGIEVQVTVPFRAGMIILPSLGRLLIPEPASHGAVQLAGGDGQYRVRGSRWELALPADLRFDTAEWQPVRRLDFGSHGRPVTVRLDDVDPYRAVGGMQPMERLSGPAFIAWLDTLLGSWGVLAERHPRRADELSAWPPVLIPLTPDPDGPALSATSRDASGAIALTLPSDAVATASTLIHEHQHSKLGALLDLVPLYDVQDDRRLYSPWRADPRPIGGLLQAVYAFLAVADFEAGQAQPDRSGLGWRPSGYQVAREQLRLGSALDSLERAASLSAAGRRFVAGVRGAWSRLPAVGATAAEWTLARLVNDHHRISWRLRNLLPDQDLVAGLAELWRSGGRPRSLSGQVTATSRRGPVSTVEPLHEIVMKDALPDDIGDTLLVAGDYGAAMTVFTGQLQVPADDRAWVGLAVAGSRVGLPEARRGFAEAPEVVRALHDHLRADHAEDPDPSALAAWVGA